jgi:hypothetical protein
VVVAVIDVQDIEQLSELLRRRRHHYGFLCGADDIVDGFIAQTRNIQAMNGRTHRTPVTELVLF